MKRPDTLLDRLGVMVESRAVRTLLVVLIIVSLLPQSEVQDAFRWLFVIAFGGELVIRIPLLIRRRRHGRASVGELAFLLIDFAAFLSFLPLEEWVHQRFEWLVFMRLSRLLVLLRFARELAADLYSILTRREQLQQFALVTVAVSALAFVSAVLLSQLAIPHDYDGVAAIPDGFADRMWWSFRQLESADNLVANLHVHPVVGALSLMLTITGVFIISFIIGIGTNVVEQVVKAERRRSVGYAGHTIVIGPIAQSEILVREFVRIYAKNKRDFRDQLRRFFRWIIGGGDAPRAWRLPRMALLGPSPEPPPVLLEPGMRWVVYRQGEGPDTEALERIGAARAKRAILLGDPAAGIDSDAITVATLTALRELNPHAHVFLELLSSQNFSTLSALGQTHRTFPLDVPWFLGLFVLHHLAIPGIERVYRFLLTAEGSELYSHVYRYGEELESIQARADEDGMIAVEELSRLAAVQNTVLLGVMLGERPPDSAPHDLIMMDGLVPWVNPLDAPVDPRLIELGAEAGRVPADRLRGVIALGDNYGPVRALASSIAEGDQPPEPHEQELDATIGEPTTPPRRVLVVGYSDAVASMTHRLAELTTDAHVEVAFDGDPRHMHQLKAALVRAGVTLEAHDGGRRWEAELRRGGRLSVRSDEHGDAMETALAVLAKGEFEAVVFLAEDDAKDADARTALRMMRLAEHLMTRTNGHTPHVLAELTTLRKGERARAHVAGAFAREGREPPRITLVSTEQVRNYFMVHSAFVPGINEVYSQLLGQVGQDLVRLPVDSDGPVTMSALRAVLRERRFVPIAIERGEQEAIVNPDPDAVYDGVTGVIAVGESGDG